MGIGSADAEGGDRSPACMSRLRPGTRLGKQRDGACSPVNVGSRLINMQALGQDAVAHGHHHFDDPANPSGSLCMTNIGLE